MFWSQPKPCENIMGWVPRPMMRTLLRARAFMARNRNVPRIVSQTMDMTAARILTTYVALTLLSTLASSFIWGINTLFLLDAKLSITQAFTANAFFTAKQVIFEIPT